MIVLKATQEQKVIIEGLTSGNNLIRFTKDVNGNYIVGKEILKDPAFAHLQSEFSELQEIEYNPIISDARV